MTASLIGIQVNGFARADIQRPDLTAANPRKSVTMLATLQTRGVSPQKNTNL